MRRALQAIALTAGMTGTGSFVHAEPTHDVTVSAGKFDRVETAVQVKAPAGLPDFADLDDGAGHVSHFEVHDGVGWFIIRDLKAGESRTYHVVALPKGFGTDSQTVAVKKDTGTLHVAIRGKDAFVYQSDKTPLPAGFEPEYQRGGYIYPVMSPSGRLVVDDYTPIHKHHHGIWSPWSKTEFQGRHPDFWNMGDKTGTVEPVSFGREFSGPIAGGFHAEHRMVDLSAKPKPVVALNEQWDVTSYSVGAGGRPYYLFDIAIHQQCATASPLSLLTYLYGGLGIRGNRNWVGAANCVFLTSEGKDRANGNKTQANWAYIGGKVDGQMSGVALFCAPENFRAPQPLRLHPTEPFLCWSPAQAGDFQITPDKPYAARYRILVIDGDPDKALFDRVWNDFATPPEVKPD
jgi:hypothetical protein